ncbi:hypothetical protein CE143_16435 [Photorhabdus luminescens]|uniref:Aspartyl protease n=1 Tax=Photorhabdus akhurstii TaxID=171438 RepID=A0ABX8LZK5_9GAMM|nr:hypothetical protein [Photorhabdus akhurstii]PQQ26982.1 hypothetical protein C6H64_17150 [Photorhabdus luminescens]PQQ40933.1 hypothetical protein C6H65_12340 [Photorhabdus luminescens]QXF34568.1 hypothetical protein B0X70_16440 [Photorhabdus akhurstii]UJD76394.1 hypothetical protein CE143_16435 [Photorhabdus luminescens]
MIKAIFVVLFFSSFSYAYEKLPILNIRYDDNGLPIVDATISNRYHTLMLDTGSSKGLHLYSYEIEKLLSESDLKSMKKQANIKLGDLSGRTFTVSRWMISELLISNILFKNIELVNLIPWGLSLGDTRKDPESEVIGLGAFKEQMVLLDFKDNKLQILTNQHYDITSWYSYHFNLTPSGISLRAEINEIPLNIILDTAATHSIIFYNRIPDGTKFRSCKLIDKTASNLDCNTVSVDLNDSKRDKKSIISIVINQNMPKDIDFDGLLGMDFLRGHKVILDMPNEKLYLSR